MEKKTEGRYPSEKVTAFLTLTKLKSSGAFDFLGDFDPVKEVKSAHLDDRKITERRHKIWMGQAVNILQATLTRGGTKEEVERAVKFAFVILDARKLNLSIDDAREKYGIDELREKYYVVKKPVQ